MVLKSVVVRGRSNIFENTSLAAPGALDPRTNSMRKVDDRENGENNVANSGQ